MNRNGELKTIGIIADTLGIRGLREMSYNITKTNLKPRFVLDLLEKQAELPSSSEIAKADTIYRVGRDCKEYRGFNFADTQPDTNR